MYIALRGLASLSDLVLLLSSISERAEALQIALASPPACPLPPILTEGFEPSIKRVNPAREAEGGIKKTRSSVPVRLAHTINSFEQYPTLAKGVLERKHGRYAKQAPAQKAISDELGYPAHFEKARKGVEMNARLAEQVAKLARQDYQTGPQALGDEDDADFGAVDNAFLLLSRDWSAYGALERQAVFPPVLNGLQQHFGENGIGKKVLVPGSGMGRLASDIADVGYDVTANDMDYSSILTYHLLTNNTNSLHQHTVQPFATKWTHQANPSSRYTTLTVPDHMPNKTVKLVEGDFFELFPQDGEFDAIVSLFFIDITENVVEVLSEIHRLLKPGGVWINIGPLKYGPHTALQLSAEEVLQLADMLGFDVDLASRKSIDSLYSSQPDLLLKYTYGEFLLFSWKK
ncbi:hypothetical protein LEMA_P077220.1 [Plenodomus lingam JN3]|uniref:Uncharacterized protein n=1 Tax=Leptosphaeria maculans (strain JN3 / isolate v23.1.3 / race Av1-4-5-6-7-8) TaxID=985895 RepID=E5A938_LEPMJ|nr:hypothetical protein LEMA_P077220.1 [Plenodomus lingam JN3]CBY00133.1 hypothetical protein LEMA_P077220.1 [Plenodomus lingam JN3]